MGCRTLVPVLVLGAIGAVGWQPDPAVLLPLYRQHLAECEQKYGANDPKVARAASDLGLFLRNHGDRRGAEPYLRRALAIDQGSGPASAVAVQDMEELASVLEPEAAAPLYRVAARGPDAAVAARSLARLASFEEEQGRAERALPLYRQALAAQEKAFSGTDVRVVPLLTSVALLVQPGEGEVLLRRALAIQEKALGVGHPEVAVTLNNLANVVLAQGRAAAAEPLARRALSILEETLGPEHPRVATSASNLGDVLRALGRLPAARSLYERALAIDEKALGANHPEVRADLENLAGLLEESGRRAEAAALRARAAKIGGK